LPILAALVVGAASTAAAQPASAPLLTVRLAPGPMDEAAGKGEVAVTIHAPQVDAAAGAALFALPPAADLTVTDSQGPVAGVAGEGRRWIPSRAVKGDLTIAYKVEVRNTPTNGGTTPIHPRLDGKGFSAIGMTLLATPDLKSPYRILIDWDLAAMGPGATAVSSAGDGDAEMRAGPVSRLRYLALMAGRLQREPADTRDRFSAVWSGDPGFDLRPAMQWTRQLHAWMLDFFQTPDDPAYRVFIRRNGAGNPGGGVAFPNSFFATWGANVTGESLKGILGHEMTHTFTAHSLGKWYDEGNAVYYQVQLPWRAEMVPTERYLRDINLTAARYYTNAEIGAREETIEPNFFSNIWLNTLGYDRGALYFAILNGKLRRASNGERSIDALVRQMVHRHRAGETITEQAWLDLIGREIGPDAVALHRSMMAGGIMVPESDDYGPCFRRTNAKIRRYQLGFTIKTRADGVKEVSDLVAGTEAAKAGLQNGDVILPPPLTSEGTRRDPHATATFQVTRGGKTFPVTYLPRGDAFDAYQWERVQGVPDSACRPAGTTR
jgi:hypothetical protein